MSAEIEAKPICQRCNTEMTPQFIDKLIVGWRCVECARGAYYSKERKQITQALNNLPPQFTTREVCEALGVTDFQGRGKINQAIRAMRVCGEIEIVGHAPGRSRIYLYQQTSAD